MNNSIFCDLSALVCPSICFRVFWMIMPILYNLGTSRFHFEKPYKSRSAAYQTQAHGPAIEHYLHLTPFCWTHPVHIIQYWLRSICTSFHIRRSTGSVVAWHRARFPECYPSDSTFLICSLNPIIVLAQKEFL